MIILLYHFFWSHFNSISVQRFFICSSNPRSSPNINFILNACFGNNSLGGPVNPPMPIGIVWFNFAAILLICGILWGILMIHSINVTPSRIIPFPAPTISSGWLYRICQLFVTPSSFFLHYENMIENTGSSA